jgi:hypothetical protein
MSYCKIIQTKRGQRRLWYCKKCGRRSYLDMKGGTYPYKTALVEAKVCSGCGMLDFACNCLPIGQVKKK